MDRPAHPPQKAELLRVFSGKVDMVLPSKKIIEDDHAAFVRWFPFDRRACTHLSAFQAWHPHPSRLLRFVACYEQREQMEKDYQRYLETRERQGHPGGIGE